MIIDTHFHAFPKKFLELVPEQSQSDVRGVGFHGFDHQEYLDVMDQHGIDVGVLSNTGGRIEQGGDRRKALELCTIINDAFAEAHAKHPRRFKAFARLPMVNLDDCVRELERCYRDLNMHGVILSTNLAGRYLDEPEFKPFWDALQSQVENRCFFIPPMRHAKPIGTNIRSTRSSSGPPTALWRYRASFTAAYSIAIRPVKLIASHLGGMILLYLDRLNWREGNVECRQEPEEYFKKIYYDTAGPIRAEFIKLVYDTVGPDQILFGADYPHGRGGRDDQFYPMTLAAMSKLDIPDSDKQKVYYLNAQKLGF